MKSNNINNLKTLSITKARLDILVETLYTIIIDLENDYTPSEDIHDTFLQQFMIREFEDNITVLSKMKKDFEGSIDEICKKIQKELLTEKDK